MNTMPLQTGMPAKQIVWFGHPYFGRHLENLGWLYRHAPYSPGKVYTWRDVLDLTGGITPDAVIVADASSPPFVLGMEKYPCLTVFYSVDSHIHSWHAVYGRAFDVCLVTHKEDLPLFAADPANGPLAWWTPPYTRDECRPSLPRPLPKWDLVFAGTVNQQRAPQRYAFLQSLKAVFPALHVTGEPFARIYPQAKLVLNECTGGELNFRVFEALGCGACLLTPDIGPALTDLFTPGEELVVYPPRDVDALLPLIDRLLADDPLRERIARTGMAAVDAKHRTGIRAGEVSRRLRSLFNSGKARERIKRRLHVASAVPRAALRLLYLHHAETVGEPGMRQRYLEAARMLKD